MVSTHHAGQLPRRMRLRFVNPAASSTEENYLLLFFPGQQNEFIIFGPLANMCSRPFFQQGHVMLEPKASHPYWPDALDKTSDAASGLKSWAWALERMENSHNYWIATSRPDGRP